MEPLIADKTLRQEIVGVSPVTWWHWRKDGKLPTAIIIGKRRFYRATDINAWLQDRLAKSNEIA